MDDGQFERVVGDVLGIAPSTVLDGLTVDDVEAWDSFAQVNLMVALEEVFAVRFDGEAFMTLRSIVDLRSALRAQLRKSPSIDYQ